MFCFVMLQLCTLCDTLGASPCNTLTIASGCHYIHCYCIVCSVWIVRCWWRNGSYNWDTLCSTCVIWLELMKQLCVEHVLQRSTIQQDHSSKWNWLMGWCKRHTDIMATNGHYLHLLRYDCSDFRFLNEWTLCIHENSEMHHLCDLFTVIVIVDQLHCDSSVF